MTDWSEAAIEQRLQGSVNSRSPQPHVGRRELPATVIVTDIQMPFVSMITFMVKWAVASVPALIIVILLGVLFWEFALGLVGVKH